MTPPRRERAVFSARSAGKTAHTDWNERQVFQIPSGLGCNALQLAALAEGPGLPDTGHVKLIDAEVYP